tara:strand:- start:15745 stop:16341 length:597 start_codon:yes stop_codon:yes gene_type:complete
MGKTKALKKLFTGADLDVDDLVARQKAKLKNNRATADKKPAKDSGDISEVVMPEDRASTDAILQTGEERLINATGKITAMLTKAGPKPLSMDKYRSLPTSARNAFARQAKKDYGNNIITKKQYETILERIEEAELYKNVRSMEQGTANKKAKPVTIDNSMGLDEKDMPRKPIKLYKGGTPKGKPRTGHTDMRKKGLFK